MLGIQFEHDLVGFVVLGGIALGRAGNDQRRTGFIDQNRVNFVDDGVVKTTLNQGIRLKLHVVAQVVEAEFVIGTVGDVTGVGRFARIIIHVVEDTAGRQTQPAVKIPHPLGVAPSQVIVYGHDVHTLAGQCVEVNRQGGRQGFTFTGPHLGNRAAVENDAAHELHIVVTHFHHANRSFANRGKCLRQDGLKRFPVVDSLHELTGLGFQLVVRKFLHGRL